MLCELIGIAFMMMAGWLYWLVVNAPEGWEDADGFHAGKKDD